MLLTEAEGKQLLAEAGIAVPQGAVVASVEQLRAILPRFRGSVVLKAQIASGARGKHGGIRFASDPVEAERAFVELIGATVNGLEVRSVLVEDRIAIAHERYVGVLVDGGDVWLLVGRHGGVDFEETSARDPGSLHRIVVDPFKGPDRSQIIAACVRWEFGDPEAYADMAIRLFRLFRERDAVSAEINPVAESSHGHLMALDARIVVDDAALHRQPDLALAGGLDPRSRGGDHLADLRHPSREGTIGYAGIGGGMALTIVDWFSSRGQGVAALMDIDDMIGSDQAVAGLARLFDRFDADPFIRVVLLNVTTCGYELGHVASQLLQALENRHGPTRKPVVFHLHGHGETRAQDLLSERKLHNCADLAEAVDLAVDLAGTGAVA